MHLQSYASSKLPDHVDRQPQHELRFALGIALGTAIGFVVGSIIALQVGEARVEALRRILDRAIGREDQPKFEFLLQ
jgi:hypothetical protein